MAENKSNYTKQEQRTTLNQLFNALSYLNSKDLLNIKRAEINSNFLYEGVPEASCDFNIEAIAPILNTKQKKKVDGILKGKNQWHCPYCGKGVFNKELIEENQKVFDVSDETNSLEVAVSADNYLYAAANLYEDPSIVGSIKINYCPMCGRRLNNGN